MTGYTGVGAESGAGKKAEKRKDRLQDDLRSVVTYSDRELVGLVRD